MVDAGPVTLGPRANRPGETRWHDLIEPRGLEDIAITDFELIADRAGTGACAL